jgi:hypothetical protein
VSFAAIILCAASQRVIPKASVYVVIDSVRKLFDTPSYIQLKITKLGEPHICQIFECQAVSAKPISIGHAFLSALASAVFRHVVLDFEE